MAAIKSSDLLDFDGTEKEIAKLERLLLSMGANFVNVSDRIAEAHLREIGLLKQKRELMAQANTRKAGGGSAIADIGKDAEKNIAAIEKYVATLKTMSDYESISQLSIKELKEGLAALRQQYEQLKPSADSFAKDQQEIAAKTNVATQQLARLEAEFKAVNTTVKASSRAMKEVKKAVDDAEGSYNKLNRETAELKKQLKALPNSINSVTGEINQANRQAVIWQKTIERNEAALRKLDASMGNYHRNVGNYTSAFNGLNVSLAGMIAPIVGVASAYEALHKSVQVIDEMTRLKLGLEAVSSSSQQVTRRWEFLSELADKTGQDIIKLTENYVNFAGATKNTALEGAEGDRVFKSFSNTFSALGKSSDVANRGLYAVQQMISKTKVNSEELNQQLAEALPGANKIFADALGVSTTKLADMMKKGEVLALDILPKVATALEKTYGTQAQKNVNTISGSWNRVTTSFKIFLDQMNNENVISSFFARLNNGLADAIKSLGALTTDFGAVQKRVGTIQGSRGAFEANWKAGVIGKTQDYITASSQISKENQWIQQGVGAVQGQKDPARRIQLITKEENDLRKLRREYQAHLDQGKDILVYTDARRAKTASLVMEMEKQERLIAALKKAEQQRIMASPESPESPSGVPAGDGEEKTKRALSAFEKLEKEVSKLRNILVDEALADFKNGEKEFSPSEKSLQKWRELYDLMSKVAYATGQTIPKEIEELNEKLTSTKIDLSGVKPLTPISKTTEAKGPESIGSMTDLKKWTDLLAVHEQEVALLRIKAGEYGSLKRISDNYSEELIAQMRKILELERALAVESNQDKKRLIQEELQLEKQKYQESMAMATRDADLKMQLRRKVEELIVETVNAGFEIYQGQLAAEREALDMSLQHELSLVQGNEGAQERIKKEFAKKDLELRQKQAKVEKAQAVFSIALNTIKAIAAANAIGPPASIPFIAIAAAIGAVQLAAALAKPLPQFYKGTDNAPEGPAWVAERGPEIHESKGRMTLIPNKTIMPLSKGDKIYTAAETRAILSNMDRREAVNKMIERGVMSRNKSEEIARLQGSMMVISQQKIDYDKLAYSFGKELDKRPVNQTLVDEQGIRRRHIRQNSTITYNNSRFSLK